MTPKTDMSVPSDPGAGDPGANGKTAFSLAIFAAGMLATAFAAVPLYDLFCRVTGFGGTTQVADAAPPPSAIRDRLITIRFDASTARGLNWAFAPTERTVQVRIGEERLAFYQAKNAADRPITGTATFNVTPEIAGSYFNKIACFCFTDQTLAAGQTVDMPVSFFIDPAILDDEDAKNLTEITLSYTFFPVAKSDTTAAIGTSAQKPNGG